MAPEQSRQNKKKAAREKGKEKGVKPSKGAPAVVAAAASNDTAFNSLHFPTWLPCVTAQDIAGKPTSQQQQQQEQRLGCAQVRIVSYNMLGQVYVKKDMFPASPPPCLRWKARAAALKKLLLHLDADIFCLQEVDEFTSTWKQFMSESGYNGLYVKRPGQKRDGSAIFYDPKRFQLVSHDVIDFNDLARCIAAGSSAVSNATSATPTRAVGGDESSSMSGSTKIATPSWPLPVCVDSQASAVRQRRPTPLASPVPTEAAAAAAEAAAATPSVRGQSEASAAASAASTLALSEATPSGASSVASAPVLASAQLAAPVTAATASAATPAGSSGRESCKPSCEDDQALVMRYTRNCVGVVAALRLLPSLDEDGESKEEREEVTERGRSAGVPPLSNTASGGLEREGEESQKAKSEGAAVGIWAHGLAERQPLPSVDGCSGGHASVEETRGGADRDRVIVVACAHLFWNPKQADVKLAQAKHLLHSVAAFRRLVQRKLRQPQKQKQQQQQQQQQQHCAMGIGPVHDVPNDEAGADANDLPVFIAGDFNSVPGDPVYSYLLSCHGHSSSAPLHNPKDYGEAAPLPLRSAYLQGAAHEPELTTHTPGFTETIDYILPSPGCRVRLQCLLSLSHVDAPDMAGGGLPNNAHPSDHLPLGVDIVVLG